VLTDLDIGMNDWMIKELQWDNKYQPERGKVLGAKELEEIEEFHRYLDKDGDGITYRTIPGTHPRGSYFTRGSGHNELGGYTEDGEEYKSVMDRLLVKWELAKSFVPKPVIDCTKSNDHAIVSIGSCDDAIREARDILGKKGIFINYLRVTAFPFATEIEEFLAAHKKIFVVEQNRDGQLYKLLQIESSVKQETLESIRIYDGIPLYAHMIVDEIEKRIKESKA